MRVLVTGSSGQIGTNLALRLQADGHDVFGVDKRQNAWSDAFPTLLQDLAGHYPAFAGGIGGVESPRSTSSCTSLRTQRCTSSSASRTARSRTRS